MIATWCSTGAGAYWPCLSTSTERAPRASWRCVTASSSEPKAANASSSRYCASSPLSLPATFFMALICAAPPTRLTLMPTFTAGRTPE